MDGTAKNGECEASGGGNRGDNPSQWSLATEKFGTFVSIVVAGSVGFSFFYDWGFFFALGTSFAQAPTTVTDHLQSWLVWLPYAVVGGLGFLAVEFFLRRVEHGMSEEEIIATSENPGAVRKSRDRPFVFMLWGSILTVLLWIVVGEVIPISGVLCATTYIWVYFGTWIFHHPRVRARHSRDFRMAFLFVPPVIFLAFSSGVNSAHLGSLNQYATHRVHIVGTETAVQATAEDVGLLRMFAEWALVRDKDKRIVWIDLDRVSELELLKEREPFQGLMCIVANICPEDWPNPNKGT